MKSLLVLAVLSPCLSLKAQDKRVAPFKPFEKELRQTFIDQYLKQQDKIAFTIPNLKPVSTGKPEMILLPLDHMPCLVARTDNFNMPVLKLKTAGTMPAVRYSIVL